MTTTEHTAIGGQRALILSGAPVADEIKREVAAEVARFEAEHGRRPCLAVVRVGDDAASAVYVRNKVKTSEALGLRSEHYALPVETSTRQLLALIVELNERDDVDGILVQLPLPRAVDERLVLEAIDPAKDVDGFHPINVGRLALGQPALAPCTPAGIIELLERNAIPIDGARACVVGRSHIVGRPVAQLLLQRDATVTICHSRTRDLASVTREADILIAAIGRPAFIRREHVKPGATVIDVGINKVTDEALARAMFGPETEQRLRVIKERGSTLVGDAHPAEVDEVAGRRTPVPGGVGLLTVAMLMKNTITAAQQRQTAMRDERETIQD
ncbi:MAG: methylenetetrahydrofolate dehydrogenase / methenyltetrahydrofolate cyclohydrolase [Blastocatellia bacterium]|jgi:methylenetetrahydrofolate dehydrogenase (NADP+)/methenyltetrahydrofolate cyclohydrolase|nr:methylenetetrahydrofolate dehydrogenase / methenyltetrahydrofolate cyclohydrolase [Blastocatellia bacterium]